MAETTLCNGKVTLRPDSIGRFDELLAEGKIHFEMMDNNVLWIGIYPAGEEDCVHVTVSAKGHLKINAMDA